MLEKRENVFLNETTDQMSGMEDQTSVSSCSLFIISKKDRDKVGSKTIGKIVSYKDVNLEKANDFVNILEKQSYHQLLIHQDAMPQFLQQRNKIMTLVKQLETSCDNIIESISTHAKILDLLGYNEEEKYACLSEYYDPFNTSIAREKSKLENQKNWRNEVHFYLCLTLNTYITLECNTARYSKNYTKHQK